MKKILLFLCSFIHVTLLLGQNVTIHSMVMNHDYNVNPKSFVKDFNGNECALLRIFINDDASFKGDILGKPKNEGGIYYVWMTEGSKRIEISPSSVLAFSVNFTDYGISELQGKNVYDLKIEIPSLSVNEGARLAVKYFPIGSDVYIDGNLKGKTPCTVNNLEKCKHKVEIKCNGYRTSSLTVNLSDGFTKDISGNLNLTLNINGTPLDIVLVEGGTFTMGSNEDSESNCYPAHKVSVSAFGIGTTEVTQGLWDAVVGTEYSSHNIMKELEKKYISKNKPITGLVKSEMQMFCSKLSELTGRSFRLPTEAEWEYAAKGGNKSAGYRYSGGNNLDEIAWFSYRDENLSEEDDDITNMKEFEPFRDVAQKRPNELGLFDMTGNVAEVVLDNNETYPDTECTDPCFIEESEFYICRGAGIEGEPSCLTNFFNTSRIFCDTNFGADDGGIGPEERDYKVGFRIVLETDAFDFDVTSSRPVRKHDFKKVILPNGNIQCSLDGATFTMVKVNGGSCVTGEETVDLPTYYIGQCELTQELWNKVYTQKIGSNPSKFVGEQLPVQNVSHIDVEDFIVRLNKISGCKFKLPSRGEWLFAAEGGNLSNGYQYSGSDNIDEVAWYENNSDDMPHQVMTKKPNELGIYDMSGNVDEWISRSAGNGAFNIMNGYYQSSTFKCRPKAITYDYANRSHYATGFRLAMDE